MTTRLLHFPAWAALGSLALGLALPAVRAGDGQPVDGREFFEKKIRPVLVQHCYQCHSAGAKKLKAGLRLDSREGVLRGGDSGPALVPGRPEKSRLVEAVSYQNVELRMPPRGKLPAAAIADLAAWVRTGAPWPHEVAGKETAAAGKRFDLERRKREHWAWQPVRSPRPPAVKDRAWPRQPVDAFVLAGLEEKGLTPAPRADRRTLLRRVSFDLTGLPPTPKEVDAFLHDRAPGAFARVVDRLLASPHFGERWARHWLDLVRYAESRGHEYDYPLPNAFQYRDYVVRALNADVPYNQFVVDHVAGDLLPRPRRHPSEGFNESILGTGFWFLGEELHSPVDTRQDQADRFDNRIDVLTKTFLGLTVACARCHDHKFDAISTKDYYALFGFLESSSYRLARFDTLEHNRRVAEDLRRCRERSRPALQRALAASLRPGVQRLGDYLLAAREAVEAAPAGTPRRLEEIARAHKLDPATLGRWVAYLTGPARQEGDPFHPWARTAGDAEVRDPKRLDRSLASLAGAGRKRAAEADAALNGAQVVVDYRKAAREDWRPDGVAFGTGPVRPGELRLAGRADSPVVRFVDYAAAEVDPAWDDLKPAPGAENDVGPLGSVVRAGRTIRTPSFVITAGKVFYLVKGTGRAYAAVDQHVLINGPLHGQLLLPLNAGAGFRWVEHDLSAYKGHRAHVEFTAGAGSDFAVALVVQAAKRPGSLERPNALLLRLVGEVGSPENLAAGFQRLFLGVLERLASDGIVGKRDAADYARLADWLGRHPELLPGEAARDRKLAGAVQAFAVEQARIIGRARKESRLALAMQDDSGVDGRVFIRGSPKNLGEVVPRRFLEALAGPGRLPIARGSGRLELARQMTDPRLDPFLARVLVNRVWDHLFGRGIVASVDNFGVLGDRPTHPELLDYLADRFVRDGWSVKNLVRMLVLSSAYQISSQARPEADAADPGNRLLHRMRVRRLEGEAIRDALLAVSGRLDPRLYGPPVPVRLTAFQDGRGRPPDGALDGAGRRSLYLAVRRNFLAPLLLAFDTPIPFSTVGRRTVSNVPAQALILMNDPFVHQQAGVWARRVLARGGTAAGRVAGMYQRAFGRPPTAAEQAACLDFLARQARQSGAGPDDPGPWADLAHVLFNVKEFIYLN